jgi:hypothetical protein
VPLSSIESLKAAPSEIHISVAFVSDAEKQKLSAFPTYSKMTELLAGGVTVDIDTFLTYYWFGRKRIGKPGWGSFSEIKKISKRVLVEMDGWIKLDSGNVNIVSNSFPMDNGITERIGIAGALCLAGHLHDLHDADWNPIPIRPGPLGKKTLDFDGYASDGATLVEIEAKGVSIQGNVAIGKNVRAQASRIQVKKLECEPVPTGSSIAKGFTLRYGIICGVGEKGPLTCWLMDPPADASGDPRVHRLLTRFSFLCDIMSLLIGRSRFASALRTRFESMTWMRDPFELDGAPLVNGLGHLFEPFDVSGTSRNLSSTIARLSRVADGNAFGRALVIEGGHVLFFGLDKRVFDLALKQRFDALLKFRAGGPERNGRSREQRVLCRLNKREADEVGAENSYVGQVGGARNLVSFGATGRLFYAPSGLVFGFVTPDGIRPSV